MPVAVYSVLCLLLGLYENRPTGDGVYYCAKSKCSLVYPLHVIGGGRSPSKLIHLTDRTTDHGENYILPRTSPEQSPRLLCVIVISSFSFCNWNRSSKVEDDGLPACSVPCRYLLQRWKIPDDSRVDPNILAVIMTLSTNRKTRDIRFLTCSRSPHSHNEPIRQRTKLNLFA